MLTSATTYSVFHLSTKPVLPTGGTARSHERHSDRESFSSYHHAVSSNLNYATLGWDYDYRTDINVISTADWRARMALVFLAVSLDLPFRRECCRSKHNDSIVLDWLLRASSVTATWTLHFQLLVSVDALIHIRPVTFCLFTYWSFTHDGQIVVCTVTSTSTPLVCLFLIFIQQTVKEIQRIIRIIISICHIEIRMVTECKMLAGCQKLAGCENKQTKTNNLSFVVHLFTTLALRQVLARPGSDVCCH